MVYVNTRMMQSVLTGPAWLARLSADGDCRLSPTIHSHINPYGRFDIDLDKRIDFELMAA
ncbi:hypothetical protein Q669_20630 [Labrenzia sp. C1B10]|nr:hypothetical protein Q669_20630 [Labrenzia sp. C1B10]ERS03286.1 hypothetical protein Q675_04585 [Labrenzia sp. C1B70]